MVAPTISPRPLESAIWAALHDVHDPEIPTISVVDLGVIRRVETGEGRIRVELLPTFVGCPAIDVMRHDVEERLHDFADKVRVEISFAEPWTTERITPAGRDALRAAGFAPPQPGSADSARMLMWRARSRSTTRSMSASPRSSSRYACSCFQVFW